MSQKVFLSDSVDMLDVQGIPFYKVIQIMKIVLSCAKGKTDMVDRKDQERGYFHVSKIKRSGQIELLPEFTVPFGDIPEGWSEKYFFLAGEDKPKRIYLNLINDHTTSYESRCEDTEKYPPFGAWGGAILADYLVFEGGKKIVRSSFVLSFSGMPELIDEAKMVSVGETIARLANVKMVETDAHKRNPYWKEIFEESWTTILVLKQKDLF